MRICISPGLCKPRVTWLACHLQVVYADATPGLEQYRLQRAGLDAVPKYRDLYTTSEEY
jgi:hypothetical protein